MLQKKPLVASWRVPRVPDFAVEVFLEVDEVFLGLEFVALGEEAKIGGALGPEQAVVVEHVPGLGMGRVGEIDVLGPHRRDQRHLVPVLDAGHISADVMLLEYPGGKFGVVPLGRYGVGHGVEVSRVQRVALLGHAAIETEHVAQPLGIFGIAAVAELLEEETAGSAPLLFAVGSDHPQRVIEPVSGPFDDLGEPGIEEPVRGIGHRAADQAPAAEALLDDAARRLVDRRLGAGEVAGSQFLGETRQVILNVGVGVNGRRSQGQFLESRANFGNVHTQPMFLARVRSRQEITFSARKASVKVPEPLFRSGVSAERRHSRKLSPAALCRDAATPRFLAPTRCHLPSLRHD